jgi:glycerol uptake facilitator-like aquaporin
LSTGPALGRAVVAEATGSALLVAVVIGSGIAAERLSPGEEGLQLLASSAATAGALVALILAFGSVSGAHLNPVVTLAERLLGGMSTRVAVAYAAAQAVGAVLGAIVANLMFDLPAVEWSTHERATGALWLGEAVATFGLVLVILGVARSERPSSAPFAVAGYIGAAYWFTSSTSFANPAVTLGRTLSDTFAGIGPSSAPMFVAMQVAGALAAVALARYLFVDLGQATDLVVAHDAGADHRHPDLGPEPRR